MKKSLSVIVIILGCIQVLLAQESITIDDIKDAIVYKDNRPGQEIKANTNYGSYSRISSTAWTHTGKTTFWRSLLYFNLQNIPSGSTIQSATLYFYSDPTATNPNADNSNSQLSGSNAFYLEKITQEWDDYTVTWNNQPSVTTSGRIWVGPSSSVTENRQIDITSIVQSWIGDPLSNYGLKMRLENEVHYRSRNYGSSDHPNTTIRPKLIINFTPPTQIDGCVTPDLTEEELMELPWYGDENFLENYNDSLELVYNNPALRVSGDVELPWLRIPIRLWVYQVSSGNPGGNNANLFPKEDRIQLMMDNLNNAARNNGLKFRFWLAGVNYTDNEGALDLGGLAHQTYLANLYRDHFSVNIHIVDRGLAGVFNPTYNAIFIARDIGESTFTHEVGHYLGLLHTFLFYNVICLKEPVTRGIKYTICPNGHGFSRRCSWTGDLLCDTDADPNMSKYGSYNFSTCTWNANGKKDYYGDTYHPDSRNYMAYGNRSFSNDVCRSNFSRAQTLVMHFFGVNKSNHTWIPVDNNRFDRFEPDDAAVAAREILPGETQSHTFHFSGRKDNVDWLSFTHPQNGSLFNYQLIVNQISSSAIGSVNIYLENTNTEDHVGALVAGVTSSTNGSTTTYTIPCSALEHGKRYLIKITRGSISSTKDYDVEFKEQNATQLAISGPPSICNENTVFNVTGVPVGATITWSTSSNITYVSGQGTPDYTVKSTAGGPATITVSVATGCGSKATSKSITTGHPIVDGVTFENSVDDMQYFCTNSYGNYFTILSSTPSATYQARLLNFPSLNEVYTSPYTYSSGTTYSWDYYPQSQGFYIFEVQGTNTCGSSNWVGFEVEYIDCGDGGFEEESLSVSPNPASEEITIKIENTQTNNCYSIFLFDSNQTSVVSIKDFEITEERNTIKIPVKGLLKGLYYLQVVNKEKSIQRKILID